MRVRGEGGNKGWRDLRTYRKQRQREADRLRKRIEFLETEFFTANLDDFLDYIIEDEPVSVQFQVIVGDQNIHDIFDKINPAFGNKFSGVKKCFIDTIGTQGNFETAMKNQMKDANSNANVPVWDMRSWADPPDLDVCDTFQMLKDSNASFVIVTGPTTRSHCENVIGKRTPVTRPEPFEKAAADFLRPLQNLNKRPADNLAENPRSKLHRALDKCDHE